MQNSVSKEIEKIKAAFEKKLPGEAAHLEMFPLGRKERSEITQKKKTYRESAVGIILFQKNQALNSVLIQRPTYNGYHSDQIALPGGKKELFDEDLKATALRECIEEIGLLKPNFQYLGCLSPIFIPVSDFRVHPFVFFYTSDPIFHPEEREVAEIFTFPISRLTEKDVIQTTQMQLHQTPLLTKVPYLAIQNKIVWGATAIILNEFRHLLLK